MKKTKKTPSEPMIETRGSYTPSDNMVPPPAHPRPKAYQLRQDNDGHWFLVLEENIVRFESALELGEEDDYDSFFKVPKIELNGPHSIRILKYEEI